MINPAQLRPEDMANPSLTAQDLADITAARPDLRPYVATHPSLYPSLAQWLHSQGVVPAYPPVPQQSSIPSQAPPFQSMQSQQFQGQRAGSQHAPQFQPQQHMGAQAQQAAQQFGVAAQQAFGQFQQRVAEESGKVPGRTLRATYALIGAMTSGALLLFSSFLPFIRVYSFSATLMSEGGFFATLDLIGALLVIGMGSVYWLRNIKWAFQAATFGAIGTGALGVAIFFFNMTNGFRYLSWGGFLFLIATALMTISGILLFLELRSGAVKPVNAPIPGLQNVQQSFGQFQAGAGSQQGMPQQGMPAQGMGYQPQQGTPPQAMPQQSFPTPPQTNQVPTDPYEPPALLENGDHTNAQQ